MAIASIEKIKSALSKGGARPSLYKATIDFPESVTKKAGLDGSDVLQTYPILLKSVGGIPSSEVEMKEIPFLGRNFKIPGIERNFDTWSVTVTNEEDYKLRHLFETWIELMAPSYNVFGASTNYSDTGDGAVFGKMQVTQLDKKGAAVYLGHYKFHYIFPVSVSGIEMSYEDQNNIEDFSIDFQYQYWTKEAPSGDVTFIDDTDKEWIKSQK